MWVYRVVDGNAEKRLKNDNRCTSRWHNSLCQQLLATITVRQSLYQLPIGYRRRRYLKRSWISKAPIVTVVSSTRTSRTQPGGWDYNFHCFPRATKTRTATAIKQYYRLYHTHFNPTENTCPLYTTAFVLLSEAVAGNNPECFSRQRRESSLNCGVTLSTTEVMVQFATELLFQVGNLITKQEEITPRAAKPWKTQYGNGYDKYALWGAPQTRWEHSRLFLIWKMVH